MYKLSKDLKYFLSCEWGERLKKIESSICVSDSSNSSGSYTLPLNHNYKYDFVYKLSFFERKEDGLTLPACDKSIPNSFSPVFSILKRKHEFNFFLSTPVPSSTKH